MPHEEMVMIQKTLTRAILAAMMLGSAFVADTLGAEGTVAPAPAPPAAPAGPAAPQTAAPTAQAPEEAIEARRKSYEERLQQMSRRSPRPERAAEPEGMPTRPDIDRYVEQRQLEIENQLRATDPWGQARRDWLEGRRQFRRDTLYPYGGMPGYPWGPVAPYYGAPWGEPVAPTPPSREAMDKYFEQKNRTIDEQFPQGAAPWTPYAGDAYGPRRSSPQERMFPQNPWAPPEVNP
jgi:hypothetical protein